MSLKYRVEHVGCRWKRVISHQCLDRAAGMMFVDSAIVFHKPLVALLCEYVMKERV